jgi:hypothetical protein
MIHFIKKIYFKLLRRVDRIRRVSRKKLKFALKYKIKDEKEEFKFTFCHNISLEGIMIETERKIPLESLLELKFLPTAPEVKSIEVEAKVVRCKKDPQRPNKFEQGLIFQYKNNFQKETLKEFLIDDTV